MTVGINEQYPAYRAKIHRHNQERRLHEQQLIQTRETAIKDAIKVIKAVPHTHIEYMQNKNSTSNTDTWTIISEPIQKADAIKALEKLLS